MSDMKLAPYIFFAGNCREAMHFYKEIFGGELALLPYENLPDDTPGKDNEMTGQIMNASLLGGSIDLRASDTKNASQTSKKVELCLVGTDEEHMRKIFDQLGEEGAIRQPLEQMFWGDHFGQLTDRFGVDWMIDIPSKPTDVDGKQTGVEIQEG
jgi:PhnB protein